jgi:serine protein kinase
MAYNEQELQKLLGLESVVVEKIKFGEFLSRLRDNPEIADTAAATLVRAIESKGEVDIKSAPATLRPYLTMLKKMGVPTWKAFTKVRGSQRTVARILNHLRAAAANGYQLRLALILKGGPGSGKSFLADAIKESLEGQVVYTVKDCPVHENPINLLNLLPPERIDEIASMLEMTKDDRIKQAAAGQKPKPSLHDLIAISGDPCQHCWSQVMEGLAEGQAPNLMDIEVHAQRLSSRKFGVSTWSKDCTLAQALRKGSRGVTDMPELFGSTAAAGQQSESVDEIDLLLEATNDRRIPAGCNTDKDSCGKSVTRTGFEPIDTVMIGQTNDGAFDRFLKDQADPNKFTRRFAPINVPYITSVSEEEAAYLEQVNNMREKPHFDPMTLKIAALLAVTSRMKKEHEVDIVSRARMYDGEQLVVEMKNPTAAAAQTQTGGAYGRPVSIGGTTNSDPKKEVMFWSVGQFWAEAGEDEGMYGLNMPTMLKLISEAVELALRATTAPGEDQKCISTFEMLQFLRSRITQMQKTPGLTDNEKKVLTNCSEFLKGPASLTDKAGLIEEEYRRVLRRQFLEVMAPDFDRRATEIFERYRIHARAFSSGDKKCFEMVETGGRMEKREKDVDVAFLNDIETWMKLAQGSEREIFRRSVEGQITPYLIAEVERNEGNEGLEKVELTWKSLPKLAAGISAKLNDETAKKLGRLLKSEIELNDEEKTQRREALERFSKLGYCEHCRNVALTYFNDYQLWKL